LRSCRVRTRCSVLSRGGFCPRTPAGRTTRPAAREMEVGLPAGHDQHRQHHSNERVPHRGRSSLAVPLGCRTSGAKGLDIAEYTDPANNPMIPHCHCCGAGLIIHQDLQRLLVLRPSTMEVSVRTCVRSRESAARLDITSRKCGPRGRKAAKSTFTLRKTYAQTLGEQD